MTLTALAAGALTLALAGPPAQAAPTPAAGLPSTQASSAVQALGRPSRPVPLATSGPGTYPGWYTDARPCAAVRAALVPQVAAFGGTITTGRYGTLLVAGRYGPSQVFAGPHPGGGCDYLIPTTPTVTLSGRGVPSISATVPIKCAQILGIATAAYGEYLRGTAPGTVAALETVDANSAGPGTFTVAAAPGRVGAVLNSGGLANGAQVVSNLPGSLDDSTGTVTVSGNAVHAVFVCTPSQLPDLHN